MNSSPGLFGALIPMIIIQIPIALLGLEVANRKGDYSIWTKLLLFIPYFGFVVFWYFVSITDRAVYEKLDKISELLEQQRAVSSN